MYFLFFCMFVLVTGHPLICVIISAAFCLLCLVYWLCPEICSSKDQPGSCCHPAGMEATNRRICLPVATALFFMLSGRLSVNTPFVCHNSSLFSKRFQWTLPQIFILWVGGGEKIFKVRIHRSRSLRLHLWELCEYDVSVVIGVILIKKNLPRIFLSGQ